MTDLATVRDLVTNPGTIAVVGISPRENRPSYGIAAYLIAQGITVYGVNPAYAGQTILGRPVYASLTDVPEHIHIVDVFRRGEETPPVVAEAIAAGADAVWLQLGISNPESRQMAEEAGLLYVEDRCIMVDHRTLAGQQ